MSILLYFMLLISLYFCGVKCLRFTIHLLTIEFQALMADPFMFIYESHSTILFPKNLSMAFELKDLVLLTYFLGLQIKYTPYGYWINTYVAEN